MGFELRIGLNSGPVIVGSIGDDLRMDYTAVGDTTNLASALASGHCEERIHHSYLHSIWRLPDGDDDFSTRWRLIRRHFSLAAEACGLHPLQSGETWICPKSEGLAK